MCIRCQSHSSVGERGYCACCVFAIRAEIEDGLERMAAYLERWAAFSDWCSTQGGAAA